MRKVMTMLVGLALALGLLLGGSTRSASGTTSLGSCSGQPVFESGASYTFCGRQVFRGTATVWVRDRAGDVTAVPGARWRNNPPYGP